MRIRSLCKRVFRVFAATTVVCALGLSSAGVSVAQPVNDPIMVEPPIPGDATSEPRVDDVECNAQVVQALPEIAPETSLPAAPPPADVASRSDGSERSGGSAGGRVGTQVPTVQGGEAGGAVPSAQAQVLDKRWTPTDNPNAIVIPGRMRSDREPVPAGFSKSDADKAETMEAQLRNVGGMRAATTTGCQVYWPAPFEVCGAIRDKYNSLGGPNSFLLFPKTNELTNPDGVGKRTEFMNGPIYWSPWGGAHPVVNHFLAAWARHGYENGYIGYPTTDEIVNPDGVGRRQHFTGSTIYWFLNEAYSIGGAIGDKWNSLGAERGLLGYPISDELVLPDGVGRMNRFQNGVIYWHPSTGAHYIGGTILERWITFQEEKGPFGYPVSDPTGKSGPWYVQQFQGGQIEGTRNHSDPLFYQYSRGK